MMQHSPRRAVVVSVLIGLVCFGLGWVILHTWVAPTGSYMGYYAAALFSTVWGGWAAYKTAKKRSGTSG
jgi:ABC-type Mn2+/Zn2+ transport system permease subunit